MIVRNRCPDCPLPKSYRCCPENEIVPRGEYEWDQSDDPWMTNKTIPCPIPNGFPVVCDARGVCTVTPYCQSVHVDGWGEVHYCERRDGHTGRHFACQWKHYYIVAVWR